MAFVILVELAVAAAAGLAFAVLYGARSRWRDSPLGRHMLAMSIVMAAEALSLLLLGLGVPLPMWVYALGFGALDGLLIQRLRLLVRAQRQGR